MNLKTIFFLINADKDSEQRRFSFETNESFYSVVASVNGFLKHSVLMREKELGSSAYHVKTISHVANTLTLHSVERCEDIPTV